MEFLIYKDNQQHGPYEQQHLLQLLQDGSISRKDLVYHEGSGEWLPLENVFEVEEALTHSMDEGQDPAMVAEIYRHITGVISSHEQIYYIAHQKPRILKHKPDCVVVTNERLIINRQGLGGSRMEDYQWKDIMSVQMSEGIMGTTFRLLDRNDHLIQVDDLPKQQLEKLCQLAQEMRAT
ncbi:MAG TPA: PH domain-containing protein [Verrucomicrobiales bacterium]|jgi:hypothetical protein|nr:PH domain-containing protein [Verrucomicrobiales bacterium]